MKDWNSKLNYINHWLLKRYRRIMTSGGGAENEVVDMYTIGNTKKSSTTEVPGSSDDSDVPGSSHNSDSNDEDRE